MRIALCLLCLLYSMHAISQKVKIGANAEFYKFRSDLIKINSTYNIGPPYRYRSRQQKECVSVNVILWNKVKVGYGKSMTTFNYDRNDKNFKSESHVYSLAYLQQLHEPQVLLAIQFDYLRGDAVYSEWKNGNHAFDTWQVRFTEKIISTPIVVMPWEFMTVSYSPLVITITELKSDQLKISKDYAKFLPINLSIGLYVPFGK